MEWLTHEGCLLSAVILLASQLAVKLRDIDI